MSKASVRKTLSSILALAALAAGLFLFCVWYRSRNSYPCDELVWLRGTCSSEEPVFVFGATWCPDCIRELPNLEAIDRRLAAEPLPKNPRIVAIALEKPQAVLAWLQDHPSTNSFAVAACDAKFKARYFEPFAVTNIPHAFQVSARGGRVLWHGDPADLSSVLFPAKP